MHDGRKSLEFCARHGLAITNTMLKHKMCIVYMAMIDFAVVSSDKSRPVIWSLPSKLNQRAGRLLDEAEAEESSDSIKGPKGRQQRRSQKRTFGSPVLASSLWTVETRAWLKLCSARGKNWWPRFGILFSSGKRTLMIRGKTSSIEKAEPENSWEATSITLTEVAALVKKLPGSSAGRDSLWESLFHCNGESQNINLNCRQSTLQLHVIQWNEIKFSDVL